jgi:pimeloyl-ACP methyl ester carboxylesterase
MRNQRSTLLLALLLLMPAGCGGVGVRRAATPGLFEAWRLSAVSDEISPRTAQTLRRWDLAPLYHQNPHEAFTRLQAIAEKDPQPELVFALAEISYLLGRGCEKGACAHSMTYYYLCAGYAYHYLFARNGASQLVRASTSGAAEGLDRFDPRASPFDPRFRVACDLYNAGLAKCIRAAQSIGRLDSRQALHITTRSGKDFTLEVVHHGFLWRPDEFGSFLFCDDYRVLGLANQHRTYGLGVPLIATRSPNAPNPGHASYPPAVSFPVTAFFRFEGGLADLRGARAGRLELYNPLSIQAIQVDGVTTPLETDLTTPLAFFLAQADLGKVSYAGFLRPDRVEALQGIYLLEPYQPGKIPVMLVHGLLSSPLTWAPLFNDLRADPLLRERYQFWFYLYPTGNPYLDTAAHLREQLARLRTELDPEHRDVALDNMVFVGHSMGGLVSKLLTVDSGDAFWKLVSSEPFDKLRVDDETRANLQRVFFFDRQECVKRVVFLGTPHHGSKLSPSPPARLARHFIRLPKNVLTTVQELSLENPGTFFTIKPGKVPTSIDLLAPHAPALEVLAALPLSAGVSYHSIIGVTPPTGAFKVADLLAGIGKNEPGDGVVPYTSAHIEPVESELVVPAEHTEVHHHPLSVQEVRRILLEHCSRPQVPASK